MDSKHVSNVIHDVFVQCFPDYLLFPYFLYKQCNYKGTIWFLTILKDRKYPIYTIACDYIIL